MSATQESLNDIISGKEIDDDDPAPTGDTVDKTAAPPAAGKTEKVDEKPDGKTAAAGEDAGKPKTDDAAAAAAKVEPPAAKTKDPVGAIIELRRRTQAAEARVRELEGKGEGTKPSVLENEDEAFSTRIDEGTRGIREQLYQMSVKAARREHGENYAAAEEAFAEAAEKDDRLIAALRSSSDPGEYIYSIGLQIKELADVGGDFVRYREKITTESRAQLAEKDTRIKALEAQVAALTQQKTDLEALPRSLNSRASGAAPAAGDEDDEPIGKITRFGNQSR